MVLSVRRRNHWGRGRFCLIFLARILLVRKDFWEGYSHYHSLFHIPHTISTWCWTIPVQNRPPLVEGKRVCAFGEIPVLYASTHLPKSTQFFDFFSNFSRDRYTGMNPVSGRLVVLVLIIVHSGSLSWSRSRSSMASTRESSNFKDSQRRRYSGLYARVLAELFCSNGCR